MSGHWRGENGKRYGLANVSTWGAERGGPSYLLITKGSFDARLAVEAVVIKLCEGPAPVSASGIPPETSRQVTRDGEKGARKRLIYRSEALPGKRPVGKENRS